MQLCPVIYVPFSLSSSALLACFCSTAAFFESLPPVAAVGEAVSPDSLPSVAAVGKAVFFDSLSSVVAVAVADVAGVGFCVTSVDALAVVLG